MNQINRRQFIQFTAAASSAAALSFPSIARAGAGAARLEDGTLDIVQAALVSGEVEVDITGTVDLSDGTLHLSVLFTRRSEDGTARVGGTLGGTLDAPTLRVTRR